MPEEKVASVKYTKSEGFGHLRLLKYLSKRPARPVGRWKDIKDDVHLMLLMVDGEFKGHYSEALALHHAQVSETPFQVFVLNSKFEATAGFKHRVVVNAEIVEAPDEVDWTLPDNAPDELRKQKVERPKLPNKGPMAEACVSFPHRKSKAVERYNKIRVRYLTPNWRGKLVEHEEELEGLASQVFQHEIGHAEGKNIFGLYAEDMTK